MARYDLINTRQKRPAHCFTEDAPAQTLMAERESGKYLKVCLCLPICFLILIFVSGCNQNSATLLRRFTPPEDEARATNYIAELRQGNYDEIQNDIDASIKTDDIHNRLVEMAALIPSQEPISVKVVGANQFHSQDTYKLNLTFEYQFPTNWVLINVALKSKDGVSTIYGFNVQPLSTSLEEENKFTLANKSMFQYIIFALAISIPIFTLGVLVLCIRTKMEKRKWFWIIFILLGVGKITMNWTSGHWQFGVFQIMLFGAGAFAPLYGAWTIAVSVPLGAIIFLLRRKSLTVAIEP